MTNLRGVYAITDEKLIPESSFADTVQQAIEGGARIIQYRDKSTDTRKRRAQALALKHLCRQYNAVLIINDDIELAREVDADGVHIGIHDTGLADARKGLGRNKIIGVSCYNRFELAEQAVAEGADYIAFGSFYPSRIKPDAPRASPELLIKARQQFNIPVCAIGGITASNAQPLIASGASMLAVISEIFSAPDIYQSSKILANYF